MCRLFGMSGGERRVRATFWLLRPMLVVDASIVLDGPPARPLTLDDLHPPAAAAQAPRPAH